jgi:hypothetical protein
VTIAAVERRLEERRCGSEVARRRRDLRRWTRALRELREGRVPEDLDTFPLDVDLDGPAEVGLDWLCEVFQTECNYLRYEIEQLVGHAPAAATSTTLRYDAPVICSRTAARPRERRPRRARAPASSSGDSSDVGDDPEGPPVGGALTAARRWPT